MSSQPSLPALTPERRALLFRRLADARAILGCGDDPDRTAAIEEVERLEGELAACSSARGQAPAF